jgi:glycosyltransferase involved in cell wall biosynthesis
MSTHKTISIIVPVYNGEKTILSLFNSIKNVFDTQLKEVSFQVIFVYDCGNDNSWEKIVDIKQNNSAKVKAIKLSRNYGQHNAIICGIKNAESDFIITMDEDLQHDPSYIVQLIEEQKSGNYDVVYAKYKERKHNFFRNFTSWVMNSLLMAGIPNLHPHYSSYRLIKTEIAKECTKMRNSYTFLDGYLSWLTKKVSSIEIEHKERPIGESSYSIGRLVNHSLNIFFTFSDLPFKLFTFASTTIFLFTFSYSTYIVVRKILYNDIPSGYSSIIIFLGIGLGFLLLGLGIITAYVHRINEKITQKPNFYESEIL